MSDPPTILTNISKAKQFLAEAITLTEILEIRDAAVAAQAYATAKNADEASQLAVEIKLRAERKAGEFLRDDPNIGSGKGSTLEPLGIDKKESHRWQRIANIPEDRFEEYLANATKRTQSALLLEAARMQHHESEPVDTPEFPEKQYRCIVVDPPWPMKKSERTERPNQGKYLDYRTMTLEEIGELSIQDLVNPDGCHVYLWTTHRFLPDAFDIFEKWGVEYHCTLTWIKPTGMTPFSWMFNSEFVLFGWIGTFKVEKMGIKTTFEAKGREHSRKPDVFYDRVKEVSPGPRLDMFSREDRDGFETWGIEVNQFE